MQNTAQAAITQEQIGQLVTSEIPSLETWSFIFWLKALQDDNLKLPTVYNISDCKVVGGNPTFPPLPNEKIGLMFLSSGTYEAVVVGGVDKWRRLYDGTTFDPSTNIP